MLLVLDILLFTYYFKPTQDSVPHLSCIFACQQYLLMTV